MWPGHERIGTWPAQHAPIVLRVSSATSTKGGSAFGINSRGGSLLPGVSASQGLLGRGHWRGVWGSPSAGDCPFSAWLHGHEAPSQHRCGPPPEPTEPAGLGAVHSRGREAEFSLRQGQAVLWGSPGLCGSPTLTKRGLRDQGTCIPSSGPPPPIRPSIWSAVRMSWVLPSTRTRVDQDPRPGSLTSQT